MSPQMTGSFNRIINNKQTTNHLHQQLNYTMFTHPLKLFNNINLFAAYVSFDHSYYLVFWAEWNLDANLISNPYSVDTISINLRRRLTSPLCPRFYEYLPKWTFCRMTAKLYLIESTRRKLLVKIFVSSNYIFGLPKIFGEKGAKPHGGNWVKTWLHTNFESSSSDFYHDTRAPKVQISQLIGHNTWTFGALVLW